MKHILHVVGARPNFVKAAPVLRAIRKLGLRQTLVHTGQHYDRNMSEVFFAQLEIPEPDINLGVGSGSHAAQTAEIMRRFEAVVVESGPDLVLVYGDVNSTAAAALVCGLDDDPDEPQAARAPPAPSSSPPAAAACRNWRLPSPEADKASPVVGLSSGISMPPGAYQDCAEPGAAPACVAGAR